MIKNIKKDDVSAIPFVISKRWNGTNRSNQDKFLGIFSFIDEEIYGVPILEEVTSQPLLLEEESDGSVSSEFLDYGDGWKLDCDLTIRYDTGDPDFNLILESLPTGYTGSLRPFEILTESSLPIFLETYFNKAPYNGPPYIYDIDVDDVISDTSCDLVLEQYRNNFIKITTGIKVKSDIVYNPITDDINVNESSKRITYNQVKNLFYNDSSDPTKLLGLENLDLFSSFKKRKIFDKIKLVTIPQAYFGDKIVESSVAIVENSGNQPYTVVDDGFGNLHVRDKIFSVIVSDSTSTSSYYNSSSFVNMSDSGVYRINESSDSVNWQYYNNNVLYVNRDISDKFFVYEFDVNDVIQPSSKVSNLIYVGDSSRNSNISDNIPHSQLMGYFRKVECGEDFVAVLKLSGELVSWGTSSVTSLIPQFDRDLVDIASGCEHIIALDSSGKIYVWGSNDSTGSTLPPTTNDFNYITAGPSGSVVIHSDETIYGFGSPSNTMFSNIPQIKNVKKIRIGKSHGLILDTGSNLYSWSSNSDYSQSLIPSEALSGVVDIACGDDHSIVLKSDGRVISWGKNSESQSYIPFGDPILGWDSGVDRIATIGMENCINVWAKGNRTAVGQRKPHDVENKPFRYCMTWGKHPIVTEYMVVDIHLGSDYTIFDTNSDYHKFIYNIPFNTAESLYGTADSSKFSINMKNTNEFNVTDIKAKISRIHSPHSSPMFSGLGFISDKFTNKEKYSYISTGSVNSIGLGIKSFYLNTGSAELNDPHYGGYKNVTTYITKLYSPVSMGETGGRDYRNSMTGKFVSFNRDTGEIKINVESSSGDGIYSDWAIDFKRIIVQELLKELNLSNSKFSRFYLSGSSYSTSSNYDTLLADELFMSHYIETSKDYDQFK